MSRRPPTVDPELKAHREWLGYLQPVGLVVAPAAMLEAGWVVPRSGSDLLERQERYREALEQLGREAEADDSDGERGFRSLADLLTEHLGWDPEQLDKSPEAIAAHTRELPELGETLAPTAVVPAAAGEGAQLLVMELPLAAAFDQKTTDGEHLWRASAQERLERLLRETGVEAGLLFNGSQLRLVVAPKGESSGHLTFRLSDLAAVSGRLMFSGLDLLLGQSHVFLDPDGYRLADVLKKSRSFQAVVSNALADQVLAALWDLLRGFQQADELGQRLDTPLLGDLPDTDPEQLYGGLITVLMRLVFLLYAEDEALMPADPVYEQNYKVSGIFEQLQRDEAEYPDTMEQRYGAWAGLMSLCRLVFDGGGPTEDYLPARHGQLFNPEEYHWLETPWISDGVVLAVLRNLLIVNGERISYRALDVEQIGSVYEGIMGYAVRRIPGRCIGLKSKPQGAKKQITTAVDLDALLALPGGKRKAWLEEEAGTTLPTKAANALKAAGTETELLEALAPRIDRKLFDGPQAAGGLVFQPTEERRRSGSHYTPRSLTRPIVEEALRPWLERCNHRPTAAQILDLKICDPAMGSGAFLVESCRFLAELLEQAWTREGLPGALKPGGRAHGEEPLIYARRLIAQSCLYGVDKNPFAVNLARLSLWLVSLSKDAPFTFVDHALKCGDSLVGMERSEIEKALRGAYRQGELHEAYLDQVRQQEARSFALFHADSRSDADDAQKRQALEELNASTAYLRTVGDLLVAAFFNGKKPKDREELKQLYLAATLQHSSAADLEDELAEPLERLREGEKGIQPLHWQLAFPDVFGRPEPGFDVFVGNPPFLGGKRIPSNFGASYSEFIKAAFPCAKGAADLSAYFFRQAYEKLSNQGALGFIATNTISETETRAAGLMFIENNGGVIYYAETDRPWPATANVVVSSVGIAKNLNPTCVILNGNIVSTISSSLSEKHDFARAKRLAHGIPYAQGVTLMGSRFVLEADEIEPVCAQNPGLIRFLRTYVNGDILNSTANADDGRRCVDFGEMELSDIHGCDPFLKELTSAVQKERENQTKQIHEYRPWLFWDKRTSFFQLARRQEKIIACARVSSFHAFSIVDPEKLYAQSVKLFAPPNIGLFAILQSTLHMIYSKQSSASLGKGVSYSTSTSFDTFPFPESAQIESLAQISEEYSDLRRRAIDQEALSLSNVYSRMNSPFEAHQVIEQLRGMHELLDRLVLKAYGWDDIAIEHGYCMPVGSLDAPSDELVVDICGEFLQGKTIFCKHREDAIRVEEALASGRHLSGGRTRLWSYQWPEKTTDILIGRILALNAERYAKEVAQGLHSTGAKQVGKTAGPATGKRRGRPPKVDKVGEAGGTQAEQIGLGL